jgi:hypothetical protein
MNYYGKEHEAIDVMREWMTPEEFKGFLKGNAIKYLSRAGKKSNNSELDDVYKASVYINWLLEVVGKEEVEEELELGFA